jgi:Fe-S-cluster-containing dehydrogenase component/formate-dependent nitrite reductase membrane component NrfD
MKYGFVIDNRKCIGCHACTVACKAEHEVPIGVNRTWVKYVEKGVFPNTRRLFSVLRCNHCEAAPCVDICPVTALYTRPDGIVDFDNARCIGCKSCIQACPYDAIYIDPETETAAKCNYCAHRVETGLEPACVVVCPEQAIISGDLNDPGSAISRHVAREQVTARKVEKGTAPKLYYIDGDDASLNPSAAGPSLHYLWSAQATGVGHFARPASPAPEPTGASGPDATGAGSTSGEWLEDAGASVHVLVPAAGHRETLRQKGHDVLREETRRVYDVPSKGAVWGWEVSAYMWTKSVAAGAFLIPFGLGAAGWEVFPIEMRWFGVLVSLFFLAATGALLIVDLDRPARFLYVLLRPQWKSWLVRGAYIMGVYTVILAVWMVAQWLDLESIRVAAELAGLVFAVLAAVYTAFLLAQAKGRDFWQSPMLPAHMMVHSFMAGASLYAFAALFVPGSGAWLDPVRWILAGGILFHLATEVLEHMTPRATEDARRTVELIEKGPYRVLFWVGILLFGNLVPLGLVALGGTGPVVAAGALTLIGIYLAEHIWVHAPQRIPTS